MKFRYFQEIPRFPRKSPSRTPIIPCAMATFPPRRRSGLKFSEICEFHAFYEICRNSVNFRNFQEIHHKSLPGGNVAVAQRIVGVLRWHFLWKLKFTENLEILRISWNFRKFREICEIYGILRFTENPLAEYLRNTVLQQHFSPRGDGE